jgi:hypothetical protein
MLDRQALSEGAHDLQAASTGRRRCWCQRERALKIKAASSILDADLDGSVVQDHVYGNRLLTVADGICDKFAKD